jgi:hypothetical protein
VAEGKKADLFHACILLILFPYFVARATRVNPVPRNAVSTASTLEGFGDDIQQGAESGHAPPTQPLPPPPASAAPLFDANEPSKGDVPQTPFASRAGFEIFSLI